MESNVHWKTFEVRRGFTAIEKIYPIVEGRGWIGGSYAAFMAYPGDNPIIPNDLDIFARSEYDAKSMARRLRTNSWFAEDENEVSISLSRIKQLPDLKVQIIKPSPRWKNFPADILNDFDFDICRAVLVSPCSILADEHVGFHYGKILRVNNPLRSLKRVIKYAARGVDFNDHELLKLFQAWSQLPAERQQEAIETARKALEPPHMDSGFWEFDEDDDWFEGEE